MQRFWSVLFGVVMSLALLLFVVAPFVPGWWLPQDVASFGHQVDGLFYLILGITGFFFILTEAILVYFMYVYAGGPGTREHVFGHHYAEEKVAWTSFFKRIFKPVTALIHDQHRLELTWTLVPGLILLFIAIAQIQAWAEIKYQKNMPAPVASTQQLEVTARQWEWRIRYPSAERMASWEKQPGEPGYEDPKNFAQNLHLDDLHTVNEVHVWQGDPNVREDGRVLVHLKTQDVIHSFFLPHLRLKQDALPGKTIPVWFKAIDFNTVPAGNGRWAEESPAKVWELACAEYCGTRHSLMRGKLYVHRDKADFLAWLRQAEAEQGRTSPAALAAAR